MDLPPEQAFPSLSWLLARLVWGRGGVAGSKGRRSGDTSLLLPLPGLYYPYSLMSPQ